MSGKVENLTRMGKGRPKGAVNKATADVREFAQKFIDDADYRQSLRRRVLSGKAPHMEQLIWHYRYGKPPDKVQMTGEDGAPIGLQIIFGGRYKPGGEPPA